MINFWEKLGKKFHTRWEGSSDKFALKQSTQFAWQAWIFLSDKRNITHACHNVNIFFSNASDLLKRYDLRKLLLYLSFSRYTFTCVLPCVLTAPHLWKRLLRRKGEILPSLSPKKLHAISVCMYWSTKRDWNCTTCPMAHLRKRNLILRQNASL